MQPTTSLQEFFFKGRYIFKKMQAKEDPLLTVQASISPNLMLVSQPIDFFNSLEPIISIEVLI